MVHLAAVPETINAEGSARVFVDTVVRLHGLPSELVSDRDPRFTAEFWQSVFRSLGTRLKMSTADHPQTDGQTERTNRVLEEILRGYAHSFSSWSAFLPMAEFAINNSTHVSTGHTPFFVNGLRHPRVPSLLGCESSLSGGGTRKSSSDVDMSVHDSPLSVTTESAPVNSVDNAVADHTKETIPDVPSRVNLPFPEAMDVSLAAARTSRAAEKIATAADDFLLARQAVIRFVQDSIADAVDRQKRNADQRGRKNTQSFAKGDDVLLSADNLPAHAISNVGSNKLLPKYIGPFRVLHRQGNAYTLDLPKRMRTHPTFYVGRLRPYHRYEDACRDDVQSHAPGGYPEESDALFRANDGCHRDDPCPSSEYEYNCSDVRSPHGAPRYPHGARLESSQRVRRQPCDANRLPNHRLSDDHMPSTPQVPSAPTNSLLGDGIYPPPPPPLVDHQGHQRWIVERLLSHRDQQARKRTSREYLVRWRGYPPSADSWEPRSMLLEDVPDLVREYEAAHPFDGKLRASRQLH
jgi:hypothetical protein